MKNRIFIAIPSVLLILGLVAWSPPNNDKLVLGSTSMTSSNGTLIVAGTGSSGKAKSGLVVGVNHSISSGNPERIGSIIGGGGNTVDATGTLVTGFNNEVSSTGSLETRHSCAIGGNNKITVDHGYAVGYFNVVSGDYGSAYGVGLEPKFEKTVAIGRYNEEMQSGDVVVIGTGSSNAIRQTALRVTDDGSVILGRAQGDISMGNYQ